MVQSNNILIEKTVELLSRDTSVKKLIKKSFFINSQGYAVLNPGPGIGSEQKRNIVNEDIKEGKLPSLHSLPGQYQRDPKDNYLAGEKKRDAFYNKESRELTKVQHEPTPEEHSHIKAFTTYSGILNKKLIKNHQENKPDHHELSHSSDPKIKWNTHERSIHEHIKKLGSKPIGKELHVYSGVGFDPAKAAKASKNNVLHSPAHISTSHDIEIAHEFTREHNTKDDQGKRVDHIMHIHLKATDSGYHIGKKASAPNRDQNETVLPAGTKLKYSHTTHHDNGYSDSNHYAAVHHFTVHNQD